MLSICDPMLFCCLALLECGSLSPVERNVQGRRSLESTFRSSYGRKTHMVSSWGARLPSLELAREEELKDTKVRSYPYPPLPLNRAYYRTLPKNNSTLPYLVCTLLVKRDLLATRCCNGAYIRPLGYPLQSSVHHPQPRHPRWRDVQHGSRAYSLAHTPSASPKRYDKPARCLPLAPTRA